MKTLILGLGNPILSDDAVGLHVARQLYKKVVAEFSLLNTKNKMDISLEEAEVGGLGFLDIITNYDKVILIDCIDTGLAKPGTLYEMTKDDFQFSERIKSSHEVNFFEAIALGEKLGINIPKEIKIYAVEANNIYTFSEEMSEEIKNAIPSLVEKIYDKEFKS